MNIYYLYLSGPAKSPNMGIFVIRNICKNVRLLTLQLTMTTIEFLKSNEVKRGLKTNNFCKKSNKSFPLNVLTFTAKIPKRQEFSKILWNPAK